MSNTKKSKIANLAQSAETETPRFRTNYNSTKCPGRFEKQSFERITVPDQALTIGEILSRFSLGQHLSISHTPSYPTDQENIGFDDHNYLLNPDLDLTDHSEAKLMNEIKISSLTNKLNEVNKPKTTILDNQNQGSEAPQVADVTQDN